MRLHRDAALPLLVVVWVAVVLGLDTVASLTEQRLLGVGTVLLLLAVLRGEDRATRVQVGVVVAYAGVIELVFAGWLEVYAYRLDGVPWFVFPGHGLIYLAALSAGRSAWAHRHARALVGSTLVLGGAWALWGVTLSDRPDALGAFWFLCLLVFTRYGSSPLLYAAAFVVVSYLEIVGTSLGTWTWAPYDTVTGTISIGNPPSGIAGGYAWFDAAALWLAPKVLRRLGQAGTGSPSGTGVSRVSTTTASSTSTPPATWTGPSRSPSTSAATPTLTTGSAVDTTAVSPGPSRASAAKNAVTATTPPTSATPASAAQEPGEDGRAAAVDTARTS